MAFGHLEQLLSRVINSYEPFKLQFYKVDSKVDRRNKVVGMIKEKFIAFKKDSDRQALVGRCGFVNKMATELSVYADNYKREHPRSGLPDRILTGCRILNDYLASSNPENNEQEKEFRSGLPLS
jgi:hypothetical protein